MPLILLPIIDKSMLRKKDLQNVQSYRREVCIIVDKFPFNQYLPASYVLINISADVYSFG